MKKVMKSLSAVIEKINTSWFNFWWAISYLSIYIWVSSQTAAWIQQEQMKNLIKK